MTTTPETIEVTSDRVACDGGGGALGHPMVFLTLGEAGEVVCGYCGRRYVRRQKAAASASAAAAASQASG